MPWLCARPTSLVNSWSLSQGVSLLGHLHSLTEKGRRMPEHDIWQVSVCLSCALACWCQGYTWIKDILYMRG